MPSRVDLHLHSRHSDRAAEWLLRRLDFPDSYSDPVALYKALKAGGMSFFTLTDHNRIDGCLEIADRPGVFISEQISTAFPEDRCRVELLAWGITEAHHRDIQPLRENIYDLQRYLAEQQIVHAVAHPLYRLEERFSASHLERLILLFRHFEGLNGLRDSLLSETARTILSQLTPAKIEALANRHGITPTHPAPWEKVFIGGSDDHGGIFPGAAYTETAPCKTADEFLTQIACGRCTVGGRGGTPLALSHGLYNTIYSFAAEKLQRGDEKHGGLIEKVFSRFMEGRDPTEFSLGDKIGLVAQGILSGKIFELAKPANASLWKQLSATLADSDLKQLIAEQTAGIEEPERRAFLMANLFVSKLAFRFFTRFVKQLSGGNLIEALQDISVLAPILLTVSPYLYAFRAQAAPREWLREVSTALTGCVPPLLHNTKRAWFTDTLEDVNGVATTIRKMTAAGIAQGAPLVVVTSRTQISITGIPIKNFAPTGEFELPEYELQKLSFPPILEMIDYIQREGFTELIISTPGPIGITALLAGKLLGLRTVGIYHTDFPQYVRILTDDNLLETLTWKFMHGFYSQLDLVYVNSESYRRAWIDRGLKPEKLAILPRGLDIELFHPKRRNRAFWRSYYPATATPAQRDAPILLYVGRISKEKDLHIIAAAYERLEKKGVPAQLAFVGDGPYLKALRVRLPGAIFTGALLGNDLAVAFASADLFLFPSTTDTYGNVVVEAHASGLPTIVSDTGGPKDLVTNGVNGAVTRSLDIGSFTEATLRLLQDPTLRQQMGRNARKGVEDRDWAQAFRAFWAGSPL